MDDILNSDEDRSVDGSDEGSDLDDFLDGDTGSDEGSDVENDMGGGHLANTARAIIHEPAAVARTKGQSRLSDVIAKYEAIVKRAYKVKESPSEPTPSREPTTTRRRKSA